MTIIYTLAVAVLLTIGVVRYAVVKVRKAHRDQVRAWGRSMIHFAYPMDMTAVAHLSGTYVPPTMAEALAPAPSMAVLSALMFDGVTYYLPRNA